MTNRYVVGDIHGCLDKLKKCLESVNFSDSDELIQLGDIVDRGPDSYGCIELLLSIPKLIAIRGNHDDCFIKGAASGTFSLWKEGCRETINSYIRELRLDREISIDGRVFSTDFILEDIPVSHIDFFWNQRNYYIDNELNCFVHGGFNRHEFIELQYNESIYMWDRDLLSCARSYSSMKNNEYPFKIKGCEKGKFKEIFVGHTPVQYFDRVTPQKYANIWDLDCGAGKFNEGTVCIMNIETKEYKQF